MATAYEIPVRTDISWYTETVDLGGKLFRLEFAWNTRDERWYLSILESDGTVLLAGLPIVVDYLLYDRFMDNRLPAGQLIAVDTTGIGEEPDQEDFGDRVRLVYYED